MRRGREARLVNVRERGPLQQARGEGPQEVQRRSGQAREVLPQSHGPTRNSASKPILDDEGANRQGNQTTLGKEEED